MVLLSVSVVLRTPADSALRLSATTVSADFCALSATSRLRLPFSGRCAQTSPCTTRFSSSMYPRHLPCMIRAATGLRPEMRPYPHAEPFIRFLFVRSEVCPLEPPAPQSGFLQIPAHAGHPCLRLYPSRYRADSGLSPVRNVRRRAHQKRQAKPLRFCLPDSAYLYQLIDLKKTYFFRNLYSQEAPVVQSL